MAGDKGEDLAEQGREDCGCGHGDAEFMDSQSHEIFACKQGLLKKYLLANRTCVFPRVDPFEQTRIAVHMTTNQFRRFVVFTQFFPASGTMFANMRSGIIQWFQSCQIWDFGG